MLALVFDAELRSAFLADPDATLARLGVDEEDRADFRGLSRLGLEVDARDRSRIVLARLVRSFSLTVAAASAFPGALAQVHHLIGPSHFATPVEDRPARFGAGLRRVVASLDGPNREERALLVGLAEWETALARCAAVARAAAVLDGARAEPSGPRTLEATWSVRPLALAPALASARFPCSLAELERTLVPCRREELWERLAEAPVPRERLREARTLRGEGFLVLGRAVVLRACATDPEVVNRTAELAAGFAVLLSHVDGRHSAADLLALFGRAGAPRALVDSVRDGLGRLLREGMLVAS